MLCTTRDIYQSRANETSLSVCEILLSKVTQDTLIEVGVVHLVSALPSELEVTSLILGESNVNFLLIRVTLALNTRKTEH